MARKTLRAVRILAAQEYGRFLRTPTSLLTVFSLFFLLQELIGPMAALCREYGYTVQLSEGFLLIATKNSYLMVIPLIFIILLSNFPRASSSACFLILRGSRLGWLWGQMLYALACGFTYLLLLLLGTALYLAPYAFPHNCWGTLNTAFYGEYLSVYNEQSFYFLDPSVTGQGTPWGITLLEFGLLLGYLLLLAAILMLFKLLGKKLWGLIVSIGLTVGSFIADELLGGVKWLFPLTHAMYGSHFDGVLARPLCPLWVSAVYFGVGIAVLTAINCRLARRYRMGDEAE